MVCLLFQLHCSTSSAGEAVTDGGVKKMKPGSFWWYPATGQEAIGTNFSVQQIRSPGLVSPLGCPGEPAAARHLGGVKEGGRKGRESVSGSRHHGRHKAGSGAPVITP